MISGAGAMNPVCPREDGRLEWGNGVVSMLFDTAGDSPVRLCNVAGRGMGPIGGRVTDDGRTVLERDPRPIVEVRAANTGSPSLSFYFCLLFLISFIFNYYTPGVLFIS